MKLRGLIVLAVTAIVLLPATAAAEIPDEGGDTRMKQGSAWQPGEPCELCVCCLNPPISMSRLMPGTKPDSGYAAQGFAASRPPQEKPSFLSRVWRIAGGYVVPGILAGAIAFAATR